MNECKYTLRDIADHDTTSWVEGISLMSDDEKTIDEAIAMYGKPYDKELDCPAELEVELTAIANRDGWRFSIDGMNAVTKDGREFAHQH